MPDEMMDMGAAEDEEDSLIRTAIPGITDEGVMALKEAIRICAAREISGGYEESPPPSKGKGGIDLALIMGEPKKKSS